MQLSLSLPTLNTWLYIADPYAMMRQPIVSEVRLDS